MALNDDNNNEDYSLATKTMRMRYRALVIWSIIGLGILFMGLGIVMDALAIPVGIAIWTTIIVFVLREPVNAMERRGIKRSFGTAIAYLVMCAVVALLAFLAITPVFGVNDQFQNLINSLPQYADQLSAQINGFYERHSDLLQNQDVQRYVNEGIAAIQATFSDVARNSAASIIEIGTSIVNCTIVIGFALVIAFWILMDLPALGIECRRLLSQKHVEDATMITTTFTNVVDGYIRGTLLQVAIITVGCTIIYGAMGIPNFIALGLITGLLNILPVIGPWLGAFAGFMAAVLIDPWLAVLALILISVVQQFVYTFIGPKIMSNSVDVHPAAVLMALMLGSAIGMAMSGMIGSLVGMLVSIPAVALCKALFVYYFEKRTGRQLVHENGAMFKGVPKRVGQADPSSDATAPHPRVVAAKKATGKRKNKLGFGRHSKSNKTDKADTNDSNN